MAINPWAEPATPWRSNAANLKTFIQSQIEADGLICGVIDLDRPQPDEIMHSSGFTGESVQRWVNIGFQRDALLRAAQVNGSSTGLLQDTGLAGQKMEADAFAATEVLPLGMGERRVWWITAARGSEPFALAEREALRLLLAQWRALLARPGEGGLTMAVVGADDRVIYADPFILRRLQASGHSVSAFLAEVRQVREQRWPDLKLGDRHDIVLEVGGEALWITSHRRRAIDSAAAEHWVLEMRPLEPDELPGIGLMPDERVAQALALIHDQYHQSPTLNDLSNAVHVSPFHFHRLFSRQVGISPKQYLLMKQLQIGRWRLRRGLEPIGEIAMATGFANHAHFTSTFRRALGRSPSEYQLTFMRSLEERGSYGAGPKGRKKRRKKR